MTPVLPHSRLRKVILPAILVGGDTLVAFAGLSVGYWLRYASPVGDFGIPVPDATFVAYLPLLLVGAAFLIAAYGHLNLYEERLLLRKFQSLNLITKGTTFWLAAYLSLSLVLKFDPPISRLFVVLAYFAVITFMVAWRSFFYALLTRPEWGSRVRQRVAILGRNSAANALITELRSEPLHPYFHCGCIPLPDENPAEVREPLGEFCDIEKILRDNAIDVLIASRTDLPPAVMQQAIAACELTYVEWKVIPSSFQIMLSSLRLQTVGRIPILGVDALTINRLFNRGMKRLVDIVGATIGLIISAPIILVLAALIRRESSGAPVLFPQVRVGSNHRQFTLYKLRSMQAGAETADDLQQSTTRGDARLLRIGGFMRHWNLDELPQFWNVLRGDMSLVGPRPERPFHVDRLSGDIPHYLPRHLVKPGMTGWAQVNGLRGDSSIEQRIQHDIYYIENWSLWIDLQIILLTFARWTHNAY